MDFLKLFKVNLVAKQTFIKVALTTLPVFIHLLKHLALNRDLVSDVLGAKDWLQIEPGRLYTEPRVQDAFHAMLLDRGKED